MHLTWLDLSFNQIETVEGLEKLTRLQDLSLHHNKLTSIDVLVHNPALATLSVGVQALSCFSMAWHHCHSCPPSPISSPVALTKDKPQAQTQH